MLSCHVRPSQCFGNYILYSICYMLKASCLCSYMVRKWIQRCRVSSWAGLLAWEPVNASPAISGSTAPLIIHPRWWWWWWGCGYWQRWWWYNWRVAGFLLLGYSALLRGLEGIKSTPRPYCSVYDYYLLSLISRARDEDDIHTKMSLDQRLLILKMGDIQN